MQNYDLFKNIPDEDLKKILNYMNARTVQFKKGMTISSNINNINELGIILEGSANMIQSDINGNKIIVSVLNENELFGGCFIAIDDNVTIVANNTCKVLKMEYDKLLKTINKNLPSSTTLINNLLETLIQKINYYSTKISILTQKTIREKLLAYFSMLEKQNSSYKFMLSLTLTDLADYLAVDRSAMMREIKKLKEEGIIEIKNKWVTIIHN